MSAKKPNPMISEINRIPVPEDAVRVYTDASYKNGKASYAFLVCSGEDIYIESNVVPEEWMDQFSRSAELYGVKRALEYVQKKGHTKVGLFFDFVGIYNLMIPRPNDPEIYHKYARAMQKFNSKMEIFYHKVEGPDDFHSLMDLISKASVRLRLGGNNLGKYRQLVQQRKTSKSK